MRTFRPGLLSSYTWVFCLLVAGLISAWTATAQDSPRPLVTRAVDDTKTVTLRGTVHPLAKARFDQGAMPDSFAANRMLLILNRPPEREAALRQFLADVHNPGSAAYHKWVTPTQFGELFGPADSDIQAAESWLSSHGFRVARVTNSKSLIEFSGTAARVREAFHSEIHQYNINGEIHYANATELTIPEAIAPLVGGVSPMNNFRAKPALRSAGPASYSRATREATPLFTIPSGGSSIFAIAPEDFATQYDLGLPYKAGFNGTGRTIGIIGESNIDLSLVNGYRQLFGLSNNPAQVVIDGNDPGIDPLPDSDIEAYLDVELSGAVAPDATVNLYISDGSDVQDPITLSAVRAVTDNEASVLSLSLTTCEAGLTDAGNLFWSGLWEQAAAQGQTVFVASGDSGSAGCDFDGESVATQGLAVNGIASTPWNVAVGGTDFLYPGSPPTASSATPFWNQTNDSMDGSLKAPLPEQPWDAPFGVNINPDAGSILAGGGGASSCAVSSTAPSGCSGYAKPIWQSAPEVPNDGVRDIPDVSLFASALSNLSAYPICAEEGECAGGPGGQTEILLVGGTSASAPAMAGIMALVNQKFGRQGQADFTLYALARQRPAVFHDLTTGTNNVPCQQGSPDCSLDTNGDGFFSLQEYAAGSGYDLASGLGSVDANALVTNWNKVSFSATTTTLTLAPTTFVHGTIVTVNATVAATSGSNTPTGNIVLTTNGPFPIQRNAAIPLAGGAAAESFDFFPGGSYQVTAQYSGDGVFAPSQSAPVSLTVTPEPSSILFIEYGPNGTVLNSAAQAGFGQRWIFSALPFGMNGFQANGLATGSVTFTDGARTHVEPLNSIGNAAYSPDTLSVGANPIMLSYAGDASYQASTAGPFIITITKGDPELFIPSVQPSVPIGGSLVVEADLGTGFGTPPTGSVTVTLGATSTVARLIPANLGGFPHAIATATLTNFPSTGTFPLTVSYPGDGNWTPTNVTYSSPITVTASALAASITTFSANPTSITRFQSSNFTATVNSASGNPPAPTGTVLFHANGQAFPGTLSPTGPATSTASPSAPIPALVLSNGSNSIVAAYSGDGVYNPSTSVPSNVNVDLSTFSISLGDSRIVIPSGQTGGVTLFLNGQDGFNEALPVACNPSSSSITCASNPPIPLVRGNTTATVTVNAYVLGYAQNLPFGPPRPPTKVPAPAGTYSVLVTASANGTIHNAKLIVVVQ